MEKRTQIIYIKPANSSFIRGDQQVLEKKYDVKSFLMNQYQMMELVGLTKNIVEIYL